MLAKTGTSELNLQSNLSVFTNVSFGGGLLNLNSSVLNLGNTGLFVSESETSRAYTNGTGYIQRTGILNNPVGVNLGNLGAEITSTANLGNTTIRRGHKVQTVSVSNSSIQRYYDIIPDINMALKATLRFFYFDVELNGINEAMIYHWKSQNLVNWNFVGADLRNVVANYVERKTYGNFDRITLATATPPAISCPANITTSSNLNGCKASVSFAATATGVPPPAITNKIGNTIITSPYLFSKGTTTVTATASNGVTPNASCSFTVTVACGGTNLVTAAPVEKTIEEPIEKLRVSVRPNPSHDYFALDIKSRGLGAVTIRVTDAVGRVVSNWSHLSSNSTWYIGQHYRPGIYFVQVRQGKEKLILKLIKQVF